MIGIDIVAIKRIEENIEKYGEGFLKKFLSAKEILLTKTSSGYKTSTIAGFWAAKEACSKALKVGISKNLRFFDIEISKNQNNAPLILLEKNKADFFKVDGIDVSITHDGGFAIAAVIVRFKNEAN